MEDKKFRYFSVCKSLSILLGSSIDDDNSVMNIIAFMESSVHFFIRVLLNRIDSSNLRKVLHPRA